MYIAWGFSYAQTLRNAFRAILARFMPCPICNTTTGTKSFCVALNAFCGHSANCITAPRDHQPGETVPKIDPFSTRFRPKKQERPARIVSGSLFFCPSKLEKLPKLPKLGKSKVARKSKVESCSKVVNLQVVRQSR